MRSALLAVGAGALVVTLLPAVGPAQAAPVMPARFAKITWQEAKARPVLRRGDSGIWVLRLNAALRVRARDDVFRKRTARAVKTFRESRGMKRRAVVNARTWRKLGTRVSTQPTGRTVPPSARPVLQYGDTSPWVVALQFALGVEPASGWFGPLTREAVRNFQAAAGLPVSGIVDGATWSALGSRVRPPVADVTTTTASRTSRSHRASIGVAAFVSSWTAQQVIERESNGLCTAVSPGGTYRGKWQMDAQFWSYYGGREFARHADDASCAQQDLVAYRGWIDRWWQPWPTALPS